MHPEDRAAAAASLLDAYTHGHPVEPLSQKYSDLTLDDAYAVQLLQVDERRRVEGGVKGHKVGLTSVAMQEQLGAQLQRLSLPQFMIVWAPLTKPPKSR